MYSSKYPGTETLTAETPEGEKFIATGVKLIAFPNTLGCFEGYLQENPKIHVAVGLQSGLTDGVHVINYPEDMDSDGSYFVWHYNITGDPEQDTLCAATGTANITIKNIATKPELRGNFTFYAEDGAEMLRGNFDIKQV